MITVTVEIDEVRLLQSGAPEQSEAEIRDLLETMKADGRLRLESINFSSGAPPPTNWATTC